MIVYKKVQNKNGVRRSAFCTGKISLTYGTDRETVPKAGKIFAFETLGDARHWYIGNELWEAEAKDVGKPNFPIFMAHMDDIRRFMRSFWRGRFAMIERRGRYGHLTGGYTRQELPDGTVICSSLRLVRQVS